MKKCLSIILIIFLAGILMYSNVQAKNLEFADYVSIMDYSTATDYHRDDDFSTNCQDFAHTIRIVGYIIFFAKVVIPLAMVIKGSLNLVSVVINGKQEELTKQAKKLGIMLVAGALIFMTPTIINSVFDLVDGFSGNMSSDAKVCTACIFNPTEKECSKYAD